MSMKVNRILTISSGTAIQLLCYNNCRSFLRLHLMWLHNAIVEVCTLCKSLAGYVVACSAVKRYNKTKTIAIGHKYSICTALPFKRLSIKLSTQTNSHRPQTHLTGQRPIMQQMHASTGQKMRPYLVHTVAGI